MLKVTDIFPVGDSLSVTLDGDSSMITNGCRLTDGSGNVISVRSVAMVRYVDPQCIGKSITVLIDKCDITVGTVLSVS